MKKLLLFMFAFLCSVGMWAGDIVIESNFTNKELAVGQDELVWTGTNISQFESSGDARGVQSNKNTADFVLTSTAAANLGTITSIVVTYSANVATTLSCTVGGNTFGSSKELAKNVKNAEQTFTGSNNGTIVLKSSCTTNGTRWIKKIVVTYSTNITKYNVNIDNSIIGGSVSANVSTAAENATVTLTATPNTGYVFGSWNVTNASTHASITVTNNQFTMPAANVEVSATFTERTKYNITWNVNGETTVNQYYENDPITFATEVDNPIPGNEKVFVGWIETPTVEGEPSFVTSATASENKTYYAVFADEQGVRGLTKLGSSATFSVGDNIVIVAKKAEEDASISRYMMYQETVSTSYVDNKSLDAEPTYSTISDDSKNYFTLSTASDNTWYLGDDTNGYVYSSGSNNLAVAVPQEGVLDCKSAFTINWNATENGFSLKFGSRWLSCRTDLTGDNANKFRLGGTGSSPLGIGYFDLYLKEDIITHLNYTTKLAETVTINITTPEGYSTFVCEDAIVMPEGFMGAVAEADGNSLKWNWMYEEGAVVPANTPILVFGTEESAEATVTTGGTVPATNYLYANTTGETKAASEIATEAAKFYVLSYDENDANLGFYWLTDGGASFDVPAGKVFLGVPSNLSGAKSFLFNDDVTTSIQNVEAKANNGVAYNLAGQRVAKNVKGFVIVNGKKYINK